MKITELKEQLKQLKKINTFGLCIDEIIDINNEINKLENYLQRK